MSTLNNRTLVINNNYQPITTITLKKAIILLSKEIATVVCPPQNGLPWQEFTWDEWLTLEPSSNKSIKSAKQEICIPEIIKLQRYSGLPNRKTKLSRRAVYNRDDWRCMYCGQYPDQSDISIDHVLPKSRGGATTWLNIASCCKRCNLKKADRTPKEAGLKLIKEPHVPDYDILQGRKIQHESWNHFI